jgi:glycine cleavage system regulatory protein
MKETLVLTIVGTDHPGIVNLISKTVSAYGGNWHESQMARLAGQFAGLMRAQVPSASYDDLRLALEALSSEGLHVTVVRDSTQETIADQESQTLLLEVTGGDHPGIVRDITAVLAKHRVNVEELTTEVSPAPMSSHTLFMASAKLNASITLDLDRLQDELETLSHDLIIELSVQLRSRH